MILGIEESATREQVMAVRLHCSPLLRPLLLLAPARTRLPAVQTAAAPPVESIDQA